MENPCYRLVRALIRRPVSVCQNRKINDRMIEMLWGEFADEYGVFQRSRAMHESSTADKHWVLTHLSGLVSPSKYQGPSICIICPGHPNPLRDSRLRRGRN